MPESDAVCVFCGKPAVDACAWPTIRPVQRRADQVQTGDTFVSPQTKQRCPVIHVAHIPAEDFAGWKIPPRIEITAQYVRRRREDPPQYTYCRHPSDLVEVIGEGPCELPCCEAHVRDVGGRCYCRHHWHAWESVA